jgi:hypothetical protein
MANKRITLTEEELNILTASLRCYKDSLMFDMTERAKKDSLEPEEKSDIVVRLQDWQKANKLLLKCLASPHSS